MSAGRRGGKCELRWPVSSQDWWHRTGGCTVPYTFSHPLVFSPLSLFICPSQARPGVKPNYRQIAMLKEWVALREARAHEQ